MKKLILTCLAAALCAGSAMAQMSVIKQAKSDFKPGTSFTVFEEEIAPALTNPETANLAETWYTVGEYALKNYDEYLKQWGLQQPFDKGDMGQSMIKAYNYWMKALPLDQLPNEKGKINPKYTKKIVSTLPVRHGDFNTAAAMLWEAQDYKGAYDAWSIYLDMIGDEATYGKAAPKAPADTILNTVYFNRGLAAWQAEMYPEAIASFDKAIELNYDDPMIYKYGVAIAAQGNLDSDRFRYAEMGFNKTGDADFMREMINKYIDANDYATAQKMIDDGLDKAQTDKDKSTLYLLRGVLIENIDAEASKGGTGVAENYKKALELDPTNGAAYYNYGRILSNEANLLEDGSTLTGAAFNAFKAEQVDPIYKEAAKYLEKAMEIDDTLTSKCAVLLRSIYYQLQDEENLNRVNNL